MAISEMGSLLRAAQALHITQPAISKALAEVEDIVGERLFDRTPYGTKSTVAGEALARHGRSVLADMDRMCDALEAIKRGEVGTLRLGVFSLITQWDPIARAITRLRAASIGLSLIVEDGSMEDLVAKIDAGKLDVVVGRYPYSTQLEHHAIRGLAPDRIVAVVGTHHPLAKTRSRVELASLVAYPLLLPPERNVVRTQLELELAAAKLAPKEMPVTSLSMPLNVRLVQSSDFVMLMPSCIAKEQEALGQVAVVTLDLPLTIGPLIAMWRSERVSDHLRDGFVDLLAEEASCAPRR